MKLTMDHIAAALNNGMFDDKPGKYQGLILVVDENHTDKTARVGSIIVGSTTDVGVALVKMMLKNPELAAMIQASALMYQQESQIPDFDSIIGGLDKAIKAIDGVCNALGDASKGKKNRKKKK